MTKNLGLTDYIYYGVDLRVKSIADLDNNKIMIEFKPINCTKDLTALKGLTLVYIGYKSNKGLFGFKYQTNSQLQAYALTLKNKSVGAKKYMTERLFVEKPGRK